MNSVAYFVNIEFDLEYGVGVVEELSIETQIQVEPFSHVGDIALLVSDNVLLLKYFKFSLGWIHVRKGLSPLEEAHKLDSIGELRVDFDDQIDLSEIALFAFSKKLSLNIYHCLFGCLKIPVDEVIMHLSYRSRHDHVNVFVNEVFALETQNILNFIITMNYYPYFS